MKLRLLSGGAANGLVDKVRDPFREATGLEIDGDFGAVGGMRDRIAEGEAFDLAILTRAAIDGFVAEDKLDVDSIADVGNVPTGIAVKTGAGRIVVPDGEALRDLIASADALFCPDTEKSTAGIHVATVIDRLGLRKLVRLAEFPNGQTAMAALARSDLPAPIGSTQMTEILNTPGVDFVGPLPSPYDLNTIYSAAIAQHTTVSEAARIFIQLLSDPDRADLRRSVGFT